MATIDDKLIGQRLRDARKKCGMTQAEVATQLDMSDSYYARIEAGRIRVNLNRLYDLCNLYHIDEMTILKYCCEEATEDIPESPDPVRQKMHELVDKATNDVLKPMYAVCSALYQEMKRSE